MFKHSIALLSIPFVEDFEQATEAAACFSFFPLSTKEQANGLWSVDMNRQWKILIMLLNVHLFFLPCLSQQNLTNTHLGSQGVEILKIRIKVLILL